MSSELEYLLAQVQKLQPQEQTELISYLDHQVTSRPDNPWLATAGSLVDDNE